MTTDVYTYTNKGSRPVNEDSFAVTDAGEFSFFGVFDGLGGHNSGELASYTAAQAMSQTLSGKKFSHASLSDAFDAASEAVSERSKEKSEYAGMKTTAAVLMLKDRQFLTGHIGDSRVLHFSDGALTDFTRDHSVSFKKYAACQISYDEIIYDDDRSSILRALGKEGTQPDITDKPMQAAPGDGFILCSDGFWEYVFTSEMAIDLLKSSSAREWAELMLLRHITRTRENNDNFTLITVLIS